MGKYQDVFGGTVGIGSYNKDNLRAGEPPHGNCALLLQSLLYRGALPSCRFVAAEDCEENSCWGIKLDSNFYMR